MGLRRKVTYTLYDVNEAGDVVPRNVEETLVSNSNDRRFTMQQQLDMNERGKRDQSQRSYSDAILKSLQIKTQNLQKTYEDRLAEVTSRENTYNTLADQIAGLTRTAGQGPVPQQIAANITGSLGSLSAFNNYGASDLSTRLNFQVSDQQILDDYNTAYSQRLALS